MARQRRIPKDSGDEKLTRPQKSSHKNLKNKELDDNLSITFYLVLIIILGFLIIGCYYVYCAHYWERRIFTPVNLPKITTTDKIGSADRYWGSYRSGHYFGMKTRHRDSPVVGLMWFAQKIVDNSIKVRHWCDSGDQLKKFGWQQHDGTNFGIQQLIDEGVTIKTLFVKRSGGNFGGDWTTRLTMTPQKENADPQKLQVPYSFLIYVATDDQGSIAPVIQDDNRLVSVVGFSQSLGQYSVHFIPRGGTVVRYNFLNTVAPGGLVYLKEVALKNMALFKSKLKGQLQVLGLTGNVFNKAQNTEGFHGNYIVHQVTVFPPFEMDVVFESESNKMRPNRLTATVFDEELLKHKEKFDNKFSDRFQLALKGYNKDEISAAEAALSNMVGGIGYFSGSSLVQSQYNKEAVEYWDASLYTAVPCRIIFPRGFLWDEGFHNLLINQWDDRITKDILGHWLDLMNVEGWIPREQILGDESRARVPKDFIIQRNTNANPPALLLTFDMLVRRMLAGEIEKDIEFLDKSFQRLKVWFDWFNTTQVGKIPGTYRWKGRDPEAIHELNPKTLASGLDDYPRASHPTEDERHVDLRCWIAFAANVMTEIARMVGANWEDYANTYKFLSDNQELQKWHWNMETETFSDYGFHSDEVALQRVPGETDKIRVVIRPPKMQYVNSYGYVSLFPFLLQILKPDNPALSKTLVDIRNPQFLWTQYGIRSLSKTAPLYMKYNTEHDGPYWRGPIWINLNYLVLKALFYYSEIPGPYQNEAFAVYKELRENVVSNVLRQYKQSGYLFEHYNDKTGKGEGGFPFTGWTATVVLIMAEIY